MTTEDDFQNLLDLNPDDHHTRVVFADWLDEHGDPRAEGYRALGRCRRVPFCLVLEPKRVYLWNRWNDRHGESDLWANYVRFGDNTLPREWYWVIRDEFPPDDLRPAFFPSRRGADDAAALAFTKLPASRQTELLTRT